jgi:surface carbohydrate biosynthesis protein
MSQKRILIIVDNPLRDLPACALLAAELAKKHKVYLTPMSQALTDAFLLKPHLVLLNYLRPTNVPLVTKLNQAGIAWSILDTEGGIFMKLENSDETTYTMTLVRDPEIRNQVAQVFVWGHDLHHSLTEKKTYPPERLLCLGTPRMDFYHQSFEPYFEETNRLRKQTARPMILINTSFAGNNPKFSNREKEIEMLVSRFGYSRDFISTWLDQFDQVMQGYIRLTRHMAKRFPHVDFILRPHPFEGVEIYKKELGDLPNVKVDGSDTVARWIWESKALVHYECSTALESSFARRPTFSLSEYKDIRPIESVRKVTDYADSFEDLEKKLEQTLEGTYRLSPDLQMHLKDIEAAIYHKLDGQSYLRIAQAIDQWLAQNAKEPSAFVCSMLWSKLGLRSLAKKIIKGRLVPPEKQIVDSDLRQICENLARVLKRPVSFQRVGLSSSVKIIS